MVGLKLTDDCSRSDCQSKVLEIHSAETSDIERVGIFGAREGIVEHIPTLGRHIGAQIERIAATNI